MKKLNKKTSIKTVASCLGCKCTGVTKATCKQSGIGQSAAASFVNKSNQL